MTGEENHASSLANRLTAPVRSFALDASPNRRRSSPCWLDVPPLEPAGTRSSAYGLRVYPRSIELTVSNGLQANSAILDLARTTAPASRSFPHLKGVTGGDRSC